MIAIGGIITTNYDFILEYAFGSKGFNYGIQNESVLGRGHNPPLPTYTGYFN